MKKRLETAIKLAELTASKGGRAYFVGGCVRDRIMGTESKDLDIEVHGLEPQVLLSLMEELGEALAYGSDFGIYSIKGLDLDVALPRKEHATGRGHRDFEVDVDPYLGLEKAARRRDFTMNALMEDVLTGEIHDFFRGVEDLKAGIIRHVDDLSFGEDPLRVLRAAQFASRFGFTVANETVKICRNMDFSALSFERVEEEMKKALLTGEKPSVFFEVLREMDQLDHWFPELKGLIGIEQDPVFHPEGDVWTHTMEVLDRGAAYRDRVSDPYAFMMLCLTHDFGKVVTTEKVGERIHAYGHETEGLPLIESFLDRITGRNSLKKYVLNMEPLHMKPNMVAFNRSKLKVTNKMYDEAEAPEDLMYFASCDKPVMAGDVSFTGDETFLKERLEAYREIMAHDHVMGRDLIEAGFEPGELMGEMLEYAHKLRLAGISKDESLKQVISLGKKKLRE